VLVEILAGGVPPALPVDKAVLAGYSLEVEILAGGVPPALPTAFRTASREMSVEILAGGVPPALLIFSAILVAISSMLRSSRAAYRPRCHRAGRPARRSRSC